MPIIWYLFMTRQVLAVLLSMVLLASFIGLLKKKCRNHMPILLILLGALSSALLLSYYFIYWFCISAENDTSQDGIMMGWDPFPQFLIDTLNQQVPCIFIVIVAMLVLNRKKQMSIYSWIGITLSIVSIIGYIILAHLVFVRLFGDLSCAAWWL